MPDFLHELEFLTTAQAQVLFPAALKHFRPAPLNDVVEFCWCFALSTEDELIAMHRAALQTSVWYVWRQPTWWKYFGKALIGKAKFSDEEEFYDDDSRWRILYGKHQAT